MTRHPMTRTIVLLSFPLALLLGVGAQRLAYYGNPKTAMLAAILAVILGALGILALIAESLRPRPYEPSPAELRRRLQLEELKAKIRANRPQIPAHVINSAQTIRELTDNVMNWTASHEPKE